MSSPHDTGIHGHSEERDPPTGSFALILTLGSVIFVLIVLFLIGIERGWREQIHREVDASAGSGYGGQIRLGQEAQLQGGTHHFDKDHPNADWNGKVHGSIDEAMKAVVSKYGSR